MKRLALEQSPEQLFRRGPIMTIPFELSDNLFLLGDMRLTLGNVPLCLSQVIEDQRPVHDRRLEQIGRSVSHPTPATNTEKLTGTFHRPKLASSDNKVRPIASLWHGRWWQARDLGTEFAVFATERNPGKPPTFPF